MVFRVESAHRCGPRFRAGAHGGDNGGQPSRRHADRSTVARQGEDGVCRCGYTGADKREELKDKRIEWHIAERRHKVKALPEGELKDATVWLEHLRAKVRARVEHPFRVVKQPFGFQKVRYRGLAKNGAQLNTLFALSNVWMARKRLLATTG